MVSVDEALQRIHSCERSIKKLELNILDAEGYWLADDIYSPFDLPAFDNSAMDGYAVCGNEGKYRVVDEVAAGHSLDYELQGGDACRIFTGAMVPPGTTAVIMQEKVRSENGVIYINGECREGLNIRRRGEELSSGELVLSKGQKITPSCIGLLATLGMDRVVVYQKPKVALFTTGDELVEPGKPLTNGKVYEANGSLLTSGMRSQGFTDITRVHLGDDPGKITVRLKEAFDSYDLILFSGGISVGDYDFVGKALKANEVEEIFYKVRQKPGKPLFFGKKDETFVFGLPGNPASGLTCFYMFVLPLLQKLAGASETGLRKQPLKLTQPYTVRKDRPEFLKGYAKGDGSVIILDGQSSSMLFSLSVGNSLVFLPGRGEYGKGALVECYLY